MSPALLLVTSALALDPAPLDATVRVTPPYNPGSAVQIDGRLDEAVWASALVIDDFRRWQPTAGGPSAGRTEARIWYDEDHIYFGFVCDDPDPTRVRAHVLPREDINVDDQVGISIDTFLDHRSAFVFWVNALGIQQDFRNTMATGPLFQWDTVWQSKGQRTPTGYVVEVAIPWKSLRYPSRPESDWGLILQRKVAADGEYFAWPLLDANVANNYQREAVLSAVRPPPQGARLELLPTLTGTARQSRADTGELAWQPPQEWTDVASPGLDIRYGPTPNLGIDASINPDFSQIESDPFLLDLNQRYALYLAERRPFFQEGIDAWSDQADTLYTRSINDPLWAAKVTGHATLVQGAALHAYDEAPTASLVRERDTPGFTDDDLVGKGALNQIFRIQRDLGEDFTGGLVYAEKDLVDKATRRISAWNRVAGLDWDGSFAERYGVSGWLRGSGTGQTGGDWSPGFDGQVGLSRDGNAGWGGELEVGRRSQNFRSETSYLTRAGLTSISTEQHYRFEPARGPTWIQPGGELVWHAYDGEETPDHWVGGELQSRVTSTTVVEIGGGHGQETYAEQSFAHPYGWVWFESEPTAWLGVEASVEGGGGIDYHDATPASLLEAALSLNLRPVPSLQLQANYNRETLWHEDGTLNYNANILRSELNYQFTQAWGVRGIAQYADYEQALDGSVLLSWLPHPGTAAWLGYSEGRSTGADGRVEERLVFAKLSWLFRV